MSTDRPTANFQPTRKTGCGLAVAILLAAALCGCSTATEQVAGVFSASPGKYNLYTCADIEPLVTSLRLRRVELEQLMARSSQGPGGGLVNFIAYRTEYEQAGTNLQELARTAADKQCAVGSKYSSGRAVF